ncbi:MAG: ParA family protein [Atopobiaceae bacterium]|nr:ParA family protein [Atopobiaceae bacterium]
MCVRKGHEEVAHTMARSQNGKAARARVITFANQKGGVAKSTTAEAFAASLTARGYAVLVVDMDAQPGNLSMHVGADKSLPGTLELLALRRPLRREVVRCVQPTRSFGDVVSANEELDEADRRLNSRLGRELVLSRALATILDDYDFVVVDTPPALQVRTLNAIAAANDVIVPCTADSSAIAGMQAVIDCVDEVGEVVRGAEPRVAGIVVTRYDARNNLEPELFDKIAKIAAEHDTHLLGHGVRNTVNARKAQSNGVALGEFAPQSTAAVDYEEAVSAYLASIGRKGRKSSLR